MDYNEILNFWFKELAPEQWWEKNDSVDLDIRNRFSIIHERAVLGELSKWRETASGSLAEIIVIDQFSRNMFRGISKSFAYDGMAIILSQEAIRKSFDKQLSLSERPFLYMPFMHSESFQIHEQALELFATPGLEQSLEFEKQHFNIVKQFGRYPHRNKILNRNSTKLEELFLTQHSGF
ncbi:MAG: DUF924 domain-containing protein [Legionellaceae bacterium]|nr:DUF924 domain-containing protein [Legionellaceae bacterium]